MSDEWVSPVDRHRHFGDAGKAECAVCSLQADRDRLAAIIIDVYSKVSSGTFNERTVLDEAALLPAMVGNVVAERDGLRAAIDADRTVRLAQLKDLLERMSDLTGRLVQAEVALDADGPIAADGLADAITAVISERDRLRAVVDAVRVMWDHVVGTADDAVMGFPVADYDAIEAALDRLDGAMEGGDDA